MYITNFEKDRIANHIFGGQTGGSYVYTPESNWYLGLSTTQISVSGSNVTEPAALDGYDQQTIPNTRAAWIEALSSGCVVTSASASFHSTASWGTIYSVFLANSSGCVCYFDNINPTFNVTAETDVIFDAGQIYIVYQ